MASPAVRFPELRALARSEIVARLALASDLEVRQLLADLVVIVAGRPLLPGNMLDDVVDLIGLSRSAAGALRVADCARKGLVEELEAAADRLEATLRERSGSW